MKTQNRFAVALTIVLSLAAGALLLWQRPPLPENNGLAKTAVGDSLVEALPAPVDTSGNIPTRDEKSADQQVARGEPSIPRGINRACKNGFRIDRDFAGNFQGYSCNSSGYEFYDTEALEALAYGDAEAASALAYRLRRTDYPRALKMAMRATALSGGKTSTLTSAAMWRPLLNQEGEPDIAGYGQAYVLHQLIARLKRKHYSGSPNIEWRIRELADDPRAVFERLDAIANRMYEEIRQVELDVTGNSTIGGDDDV